MQDSGEESKFFRLLEELSHVSSHVNLLAFFINMIIGFIFSTNYGINGDKAVNLPTNLCISLMLVGLLIASNVLHLSGLASMPLCVSMNPKNFPSPTPKTHFRIQSHVILVNYWEHISQIPQMLLQRIWHYHYIIHVYLHAIS